MPTLARVSRGSNERYQWAPIRDASPLSPNFRDSSHASAFAASNSRPRARLSRPPNLPFGIPSPCGVSPPDSPLPAGFTGSSGHMGLVIGSKHTSARRMSVASVDETIPEHLTSNNLAKLDGLRTGEVARQPNLKSRISTVSQYPVFVNCGASERHSTDGRTRTRRRPISIASTSTTGIYLAIAGLPGAEPFDLEPPSQDMLNRHVGRAAQTQASLQLPPYGAGSTATFEPASTTRVVVRNEQNTSTLSTAQQNSRVSVLSTGFGIDPSSPRRSVSVCVSLMSTRRQSIQPSWSWPVNPELEYSSIDQHELQWAPSLQDTPPPPPPKDPGYLKRPPTGAGPAARAERRLRVCTSTPHFPSILSPSAMEREGIIKEKSGVGYEKSPTGRSWLFSLNGRGQNRRSGASKVIPENVSNRENANGIDHPTSNPRPHLLVVWARFIGRAMPKAVFHSKGS